MSKTKWLCPFNGLIQCDDNCMVYGRANGCGIANDIDKVAQAVDNISDYTDESAGTIHRIGDALTLLAEETSPYDGGVQIREGLDSLGSFMPDMSDISESIDALARMINPTEYKQYIHEVSQSLIDQAKAYAQIEVEESEFHFPDYIDGNDD